MVRIYKKENKAEFQWMVGPIPVEDRVGREIITRFDTDIQSNGTFYTDSNGREWLKRQHSRILLPKLEEKVAGNYYPVTAKIAIRDDTRRFVLLTDRAQGGSSLADGSMELMVKIQNCRMNNEFERISSLFSFESRYIVVYFVMMVSE